MMLVRGFSAFTPIKMDKSSYKIIFAITNDHDFAVRGDPDLLLSSFTILFGSNLSGDTLWYR